MLKEELYGAYREIIKQMSGMDVNLLQYHLLYDKKEQILVKYIEIINKECYNDCTNESQIPKFFVDNPMEKPNEPDTAYYYNSYWNRYKD